MTLLEFSTMYNVDPVPIQLDMWSWVSTGSYAFSFSRLALLTSCSANHRARRWRLCRNSCKAPRNRTKPLGKPRQFRVSRWSIYSEDLHCSCHADLPSQTYQRSVNECVDSYLSQISRPYQRIELNPCNFVLPTLPAQPPATRSEAKKSQSLQDVLSKRVVQLEAKLTQQSLEKDTMAEAVVVTVHTCGAMVFHVIAHTQKTSKSLNVALGLGNSMHKQEVDLILPAFLIIYSLVNSTADRVTCLFCLRHQELEKLRPLAAATEEVEQRASSAEEFSMEREGNQSIGIH